MLEFFYCAKYTFIMNEGDPGSRRTLNCFRTWYSKLKKTTTLNPEMTCPHCGEKQYQTQISKIEVGLLATIVSLAFLES